MKVFIAALLSAALISLAKHAPPANLNNSAVKNKPVQTVQAKANEVKPIKQEPSPQPPKTTEPEIQQVASKTPVVHEVTGCNVYRPILAKYTWNVEVAVAVCNAESSGIASNDNPSDYHATCLGSRGLFQIGCDSTNNYAGMFDPEANIAQAYALYSRRGWQPWGSTTCRVKVSCY